MVRGVKFSVAVGIPVAYYSMLIASLLRRNAPDCHLGSNAPARRGVKRVTTDYSFNSDGVFCTLVVYTVYCHVSNLVAHQ